MHSEVSLEYRSPLQGVAVLARPPDNLLMKSAVRQFTAASSTVIIIMRCVLFALLNIVVYARCSWMHEEEKKPTFLTAPVGKSVMFSCSMNFPRDIVVPYTLSWIKEGERVFTIQDGVMTSEKEGYKGRIVVTIADGKAKVNLTAIRKTDHGWYECRISFPNRTPSTRDNGTWFHLAVHVPCSSGVGQIETEISTQQPPVEKSQKMRAKKKIRSSEDEAEETKNLSNFELHRLLLLEQLELIRLQKEDIYLKRADEVDFKDSLLTNRQAKRKRFHG